MMPEKESAKSETNQIQFPQLIESWQEQKETIQRLQRELEHLGYKYNQVQAKVQQLRQEIEWLKREKAKATQAGKITQSHTELSTLQATRTFRAIWLVGLVWNALRQLIRMWRTNSFSGILDTPSSNSEVGSNLQVAGWAIVKKARIQQVEVWLEQKRLGIAEYGQSRPDVRYLYPLQSTEQCGFRGEFILEPGNIEPGPKTLRVILIDNFSHHHELVKIVQYVPNIPHPTPLINQSKEISTGFRYSQWIMDNEPGATELAEQQHLATKLTYLPGFSLLLPVASSTTAPALLATLASAVHQTYAHWELWAVASPQVVPEVQQVLAEYAQQDRRFRLELVSEDAVGFSALNQAVSLVQGQFLAMLDAGDELAPNAFYEAARLLQHKPDTAILYSDEDYLNEDRQRTSPHFKPDWSPDLLRSQPYIGRLAFYNTEMLRQYGSFHSTLQGAEEYELTLRLSECTNKIEHIPRVLYHRANPKTETTSQVALIQTVREHCERLGWKVTAEPGLIQGTLRIRPELEGQPLISIIIPTRNQASLLEHCLTSIQSRSTYLNYEIIVIDNNSSEPETIAYLNNLRQQTNFQVIQYNGEFNFSAINNQAASRANGEFVLFLNNDVEVLNSEWLEAMLEQAQRPEVGAVGARLVYPDGTLQHGGMVMGVGYVAGHAHKHLPGSAPGYFNRAKVIQNFSAVTAACLMMRTTLFREIGGFNEVDLPIAFNDVDLCLRLRERGFLIVWTPYAELIHHESVSRGLEDEPEKIARFYREANYIRRRWPEVVRDDPYYNPNLTLEHEDFSIAPIARYRC